MYKNTITLPNSEDGALLEQNFLKSKPNSTMKRVVHGNKVTITYESPLMEVKEGEKIAELEDTSANATNTLSSKQGGSEGGSGSDEKLEEVDGETQFDSNSEFD